MQVGRPGQLEHEVDGGNWRLAAADASFIFERAAEEVWPELIPPYRGPMGACGSGAVGRLKLGLHGCRALLKCDQHCGHHSNGFC